MKRMVAIALLVVTGTAWAHRPRILDCATYTQVAQVAAEDRESGKPLKAALARVDSEHHYDLWVESYRSLVNDVYSSPDVRVSAPATVARAAEKGCMDWNAEERRTMRLD